MLLFSLLNAILFSAIVLNLFSLPTIVKPIKEAYNLTCPRLKLSAYLPFVLTDHFISAQSLIITTPVDRSYFFGWPLSNMYYSNFLTCIIYSQVVLIYLSYQKTRIKNDG